jgi:hypothetical protein
VLIALIGVRIRRVRAGRAGGGAARGGFWTSAGGVLPRYGGGGVSSLRRGGGAARLEEPDVHKPLAGGVGAYNAPGEGGATVL